MDAQQSGVDISLGDHCSKIAYKWAQKTFSNRLDPWGAPDRSAQGSYSQIMHYGPMRLAMCSDGIGTKAEVAERMGRYDTLGADLVAMIADDLICNGATPTNLSNVLDVNLLDPEIVDSLMQGLHFAAGKASMAVTGGEIAELGDRIQGYGHRMHFNWCATGIGYIPEGRDIIDGSALTPGQSIIALRSNGFRSNGFSKARSILENMLGGDWHTRNYERGQTWGDILLRPSLIYTHGIQNLWDNGVQTPAVVHITGGGIIGNLKRMLRKNKVGAVLDNLWDPHLWMLQIQAMDQISEKQAYNLWNMGQGMLLIVDTSDIQKTLSLLEGQGYEAKVAGYTTEEPKIVLHTRGYWKTQLEETVED